MGDRFPLLLVGLLVLFGVVGAFLFQGAQRGAFADRLSTYRSEPDGARALYLVLQQQQVPVARLEESLDLIPKGQSLMLLGVRFEHEREPVGPWFDGSDAGVDPADGGDDRGDRPVGASCASDSTQPTPEPSASIGQRCERPTSTQTRQRSSSSTPGAARPWC